MMTQNEVRNSSHVITGSLLFYNSSSLVLIDSGAIHYLISLLHTKSLDYKIESFRRWNVD